jgi:hypothetical protein
MLDIQYNNINKIHVDYKVLLNGVLKVFLFFTELLIELMTLIINGTV